MFTRALHHRLEGYDSSQLCKRNGPREAKPLALSHSKDGSQPVLRSKNRPLREVAWLPWETAKPGPEVRCKLVSLSLIPLKSGKSTVFKSQITVETNSSTLVFLLGLLLRTENLPPFYIFLILFLQRWLKTGEEPMRLSVEWEP